MGRVFSRIMPYDYRSRSKLGTDRVELAENGDEDMFERINEKKNVTFMLRVPGHWPSDWRLSDQVSDHLSRQQAVAEALSEDAVVIAPLHIHLAFCCQLAVALDCHCTEALKVGERLVLANRENSKPLV